MIHPKAHVDPDVEIGEGTDIWQFASVTRGTRLGKNCRVSPFVMLDGSTYGDECIFSAGFAAGAGFCVGNRVFFGPGSLLVNDVWPRVDKDGYDDETLRGNEKFAIVIENDVTIGAHAIIFPGVRIRHHSVIPAGAIVKKNVSAFELFDSNRTALVPKRVPFMRSRGRMRWVD